MPDCMSLGAVKVGLHKSLAGPGAEIVNHVPPVKLNVPVPYCVQTPFMLEPVKSSLVPTFAAANPTPKASTKVNVRVTAEIVSILFFIPFASLSPLLTIYPLGETLYLRLAKFIA